MDAGDVSNMVLVLMILLIAAGGADAVAHADDANDCR